MISKAQRLKNLLDRELRLKAYLKTKGKKAGKHRSQFVQKFESNLKKRNRSNSMNKKEKIR